MAELEKQYGCPECGNQDVRRRGKVEIESNGYFMADKRGLAEFLGYDDINSENILWHTFQPINPGQFVCCKCQHQFDQPAELDEDARPIISR
jgi:hypothetical protein